MLVCDEERSLTFAHWRSAAESERARLSAVLMSWGEAAAKGEIQIGSVPSKTLIQPALILENIFYFCFVFQGYYF